MCRARRPEHQNTARCAVHRRERDARRMTRIPVQKYTRVRLCRHHQPISAYIRRCAGYPIRRCVVPRSAANLPACPCAVRCARVASGVAIEPACLRLRSADGWVWDEEEVHRPDAKGESQPLRSARSCGKRPALRPPFAGHPPPATHHHRHPHLHLSTRSRRPVSPPDALHAPRKRLCHALGLRASSPSARALGAMPRPRPCCQLRLAAPHRAPQSLAPHRPTRPRCTLCRAGTQNTQLLEPWLRSRAPSS